MEDESRRGGWNPRTGGFGGAADGWDPERTGYSRARGYGRERFARERATGDYGGPGYGDRGEYERGFGDRGSLRGSPGGDDWGDRSPFAAAESEWGAGYGGGYGRSGGFGERGGRGAWGGPASGVAPTEPDHTGYGGFGYSTGFGTDLGARGRNHAGRGPRNYRRSDGRIAEDVNDALTDDPDLDARDIAVQVDNGEVTLTGSVASRAAKRLAEDLAERATGVTDVRNELRVSRPAAGG